MSIITLMAVSFAGYIFLPFQSHPSTFDFLLGSNDIQNCDNMVIEDHSVDIEFIYKLLTFSLFCRPLSIQKNV